MALLNNYRELYGLLNADKPDSDMGLLNMMQRNNPSPTWADIIRLASSFNDDKKEEKPQAPQQNDDGNIATATTANMNLPDNPTNIDRVMQAIGKFESGGKYGLLGVPTKGDRAFGKYQIMGSNIAPWSKEALGQSVSKEEFLNNPAIQDAVARFQMNKYWNKYGNIDDVASLWFSGRPASNNHSHDALGTSVPTYISAVRKNYLA